MNTSVKSIAIGNLIYFFREGDALADTTLCSRTNVPPTNPPDVGWLSHPIGNCESSDSEVKDVEDEAKGPAGESGIIVVRDVVTIEQNLTLKFVTNEMSRLAVQCYYRTQDLNDASTFANPLSAPPPKGWLLEESYDQDGQAHLVKLLWVQLKVTGGFKGGDSKILRPTWEARVLYNLNNIFAL